LETLQAPTESPAPGGLPSLRGARLAFAGGGTGGHIVPGLHLLEELVARGDGPSSVLWFHAGRAVEREVLAGLEHAAGGARVERMPLPLEPGGGGAPALGGLALRLPRAVRRARRALKASGAQVLLGLGGYTAAPAALAARSLGVPVALLEINACPGRATRALAPLARRVLHAWPATVPRSVGRRHALVGPPVSPSFVPTDELQARAAREDLGFDPDLPLLLVLGGSQGAEALNRFVRAQSSTLLGSGISVLHQVGPDRLSEACSPMTAYGANEYLHDVPRALTAASAVLCRGGASTLAEVAAARKPAWVVPYPHHADQHQARNAAQLGAGVRVVPEAELTRRFAGELATLTGPAGEGVRGAMGQALDVVAPVGAVGRLADELALLLPG
jgi:UDP-N-acetylglucosamine:LPS N-acetylglucosamine transferase